MDLSNLPNANPVSTKPSNLSTELAHITQEMYKKNLELAEKNKTLSLLGKINEIILSTLTDVSQIAQQVANIVSTEANFKMVAIFLLNKEKNSLTRLAVSQTEPIIRAELELSRTIYDKDILLMQTNNLVVKAVQERKMQTTNSLSDLLVPSFTVEESNKIQQIIEAVFSHVYPLIVRDEVIGALVISVAGHDEMLSQYQKDLIQRLSGIIGISIDNALLYKSIQDANSKLKALDKLKDEFISVASHELRTPMTAIKSYLWMVINKPSAIDDEKRKLYINRAYNSTTRLITLVNDMLNVSRIESGRITLFPVDVSFIDLAQETIDELTPKATEKQITLGVENADIPHVLIDKDKIHEVLINLIGNAIKFTPENGKISVSFMVKNGMLEISVTDTGRGISKEDFPKLFKKFQRLENTFVSTANIEGTGLGLYICKQFVELSGGKIWVISEVGKGTTFTFSLPINLATKQPDKTRLAGLPLPPTIPIPSSPVASL